MAEVSVPALSAPAPGLDWKPGYSASKTKRITAVKVRELMTHAEGLKAIDLGVGREICVPSLEVTGLSLPCMTERDQGS